MLPAVLLAAGKSTRMGRSKAMLPVDAADTFLTRIVRTLEAAEVGDVVVVVGHEADAIVESVTSRGLSPRFVVNHDYESGQLSSILAGLRAIDRPGVGGMLLTLVDVPLVAVSTVRSVIERYRATDAPIVRPVQGVRDRHGIRTIRHGHPVIIDRRLFAALRSADPATGAKPVVRAHVSDEGDVEVEDEGAFADVDTPEDYARFFHPSDARHV
jgi:molybdenum cofactor cytidylyltransferase